MLLGNPDERIGKPLGSQIIFAAHRFGEFGRRLLRDERWSLHLRPNDVDALNAALARTASGRWSTDPCTSRRARLTCGWPAWMT